MTNIRLPCSMSLLKFAKRIVNTLNAIAPKWDSVSLNKLKLWLNTPLSLVNTYRSLMDLCMNMILMIKHQAMDIEVWWMQCTRPSIIAWQCANTLRKIEDFCCFDNRCTLSKFVARDFVWKIQFQWFVWFLFFIVEKLKHAIACWLAYAVASMKLLKFEHKVNVEHCFYRVNTKQLVYLICPLKLINIHSMDDVLDFKYV